MTLSPSMSELRDTLTGMISEADARDAAAAVFAPQATDHLGILTNKWTCDRDGNWSLIPFMRWIDPKGAMADRRFTPTPNGDRQ